MDYCYVYSIDMDVRKVPGTIIGNEKLFLNPRLLPLMTSDSNELQPYH